MFSPHAYPESNPLPSFATLKLPLVPETHPVVVSKQFHTIHPIFSPHPNPRICVLVTVALYADSVVKEPKLIWLPSSNSAYLLPELEGSITPLVVDAKTNEPLATRVRTIKKESKNFIHLL